MQEVRPTIMVSVPRLYEKIYARVLEAVPGEPRAAPADLPLGPARGRDLGGADAGGPARCPPMLALQHRLADRLVFAKLRARTGGRIRFFVSGGAPLSAEIAKFFYAAGLPILEGYGLTETSPVIAVNTRGTSGSARSAGRFPASRCGSRRTARSSRAARNVMKGYYNKPEATAEAIDPDGWFHTGDIGVLDADGLSLRSPTARRTSSSPPAARTSRPQPIENLVKTSKFVSNAVMLGDRRPFPIMLVVPERRAAARPGRRGTACRRTRWSAPLQAAGGACQARARGAEDAPRPRAVRDAEEVPAAARGISAWKAASSRRRSR